MTSLDEENLEEVETEVNELYEVLLNKYAFETAPDVQKIEEAKRYLQEFSNLPGWKEQSDWKYRNLSEFDRETPEWIEIDDLPNVDSVISNFNQLLSGRKISGREMIRFLDNDYESLSQEAEEFGVSQNTISNLYNEMEDLGILTKFSDGYELTDLGRIFQSFFSRMESIDDENYSLTQYAIQKNH